MSESSSARGAGASPDASDQSAQGLAGPVSQGPGGPVSQGPPREQAEPPSRGRAGSSPHEPECVRQRIVGHLGADGPAFTLVDATYPAWRWADVDAALDGLDEAQVLCGVNLGDGGLAELLARGQDRPARSQGAVRGQGAARGLGPVRRTAFPTGPDETRWVATNALRLVRMGESPVVVLAGDARGEPGVRVEVLAADLVAAHSVLDALAAAVEEDSTLRGRVISFRPTAPTAIDIHERPGLIADDVVLPTGLLERVESTVLGISRRAAGLRAAGQHLPRGVLLVGPPGSGKTHTVRYLLAQSPETTAFLLPGGMLGGEGASEGGPAPAGPAALIREVLTTARQLSPTIVVLEDIDRVGADLAVVLDALADLHDDEDADVAVILTASSREQIGRALAVRPGLLDLALEAPLPDPAQRERLFARSTRALPVTAAGVRAAAEAAVATPGSFPRQAVRKAVLDALSAGAEVDDARLVAAVRALVAARDELSTATLPNATMPQNSAPQEESSGDVVIGPEPRGLGEGDGLDGGDGLDRGGDDDQMIDDLDDGLSGEDLLDLDLDGED